MIRLRDPLICALVPLILAAEARADLLITEVVDGPLSGGLPKWVELTNTGTSSVILSAYSLGVKNNGSITLNGPALVLSGNLPGRSSYIIAFEDPNSLPGTSMFFGVYGQDPDAYSGDEINGNDTVLLYLGAATGDGSNAGLVDLFGEDSVDGTGTVWEYTDSYAQRCGDTSSAVFDPLDWNIPGPNALEAGCGSDDACETANLQVLTDPWNHAGCSTSGPGTSYCIGDQGACP